MKITTLILVVATFSLLTGTGVAAESSSKDAQSPAYPTVSLADVLKSVSKKSDRVFLVDAAVPARVIVGQLDNADVNYSSLLVILRNNGLAAVTIDDVTNVVPLATIRQFPLPILFAADDSVADEEWVTRVIHLENAAANMMVPIMRPLLPQQGHLVAHPATNTIVIVDRYANAQRVATLIEDLDSQPQLQFEAKK